MNHSFKIRENVKIYAKKQEDLGCFSISKKEEFCAFYHKDTEIKELNGFLFRFKDTI
jgi:hypothetical protein